MADAGGAPIANARVVVSAAGHSSTIAITNSEGAFSSTRPDGAFTLAAVKSGYVRQQRTFDSGVADLVMRLVRSCVISGRVVDASGEPVVDATVFLNAAPSARGLSAPLGRTDTDDVGEFRIAGIPPGAVIVAINTSGGMEVQQSGPNQFMSSRVTTTYYPRTTEKPQAEIITLEPGDERSGIDFVVGADQGGLNSTTMAFMIPPSTQNRAPQGTSAISGRVVAVDGRPIAAAVVRLLGPAGPSLIASTRTDRAGRFTFADLAVGRYRVAAGKSGFTAVADTKPPVLMIPASFGFSSWIDLKADESRERTDVELARLGSVSGVIFDELGDPLQGATVQLLRVRFDRGRRRLVGIGSRRPTDDGGRFRIGEVLPGRYVVTASVGAVTAADLPGYAPAYYPGTTEAISAQLVTVATSQDVAGIDFAMSPIHTARVAGTILDPSGAPARPGMLQLRSPSASAVSVSINARIGTSGEFEFPNVPPGPWIIYADRGRTHPSIEGEFAAMPIVVAGEDLTDLKVQLSAGSSIVGRIRFEGSADRLPSAAAIVFVAAQVDPDLSPGNVAEAEIESNWSFHMAGVNGVRRLLARRLPDGWALRQVRVNGVDVGDRPLTFGRADQSLSDVELVLTDRVSAVMGTVTADDRSAPTVSVIAMPIDRDRGYASSPYLKLASTDADGRFVLALPPGAYYVAAAASIPTDGADAWQDPTFLESLMPRATTVTLGEGQTQTLLLRVR